MAEEIEWIPLDAAVERLGSTRMHVLMLVKRGLLAGRENDGQWFVDAAGLSSCREAGAVLGEHPCRGKSSCGGCH